MFIKSPLLKWTSRQCRSAAASIFAWQQRKWHFSWPCIASWSRSCCSNTDTFVNWSGMLCVDEDRCSKAEKRRRGEHMIWWMGTKWTYLLKRSTTAKIESDLPDLGSPSTKSIEISSHTKWGLGKGCRRLDRESARLVLLTHWTFLNKPLDVQ